MTQRPLVVIESPYKGHPPAWVPWPMREVVARAIELGNREYAMRCVLDSLSRGEAPYASHVFFTMNGLLRDHIPHERDVGMEVGFRWGHHADLRVFYCDRGISDGMRLARLRMPQSQGLEYRYIMRTGDAVPRCVNLECKRVLPMEEPRCPTCLTWRK
jgi:hypothetical protein